VHGLAVKYFHAATLTAVVRVSRDHADMLASALPLTQSLRGRECQLRVLHLSGTIRACQRFLVEFHQQRLRQLRQAAKAAAAAGGMDTSKDDCARLARFEAWEPVILQGADI
jgi:hypothetical protein